MIAVQLYNLLNYLGYLKFCFFCGSAFALLLNPSRTQKDESMLPDLTHTQTFSGNS